VSGVPGAPSSWGPCGSSAWAADTGAAASDFALDDGAHQASAAVTFFRAGTTAGIAEQRAFTASPQVVPCLQLFASLDALRYPWLGYTDGSQYAVSHPPVVLHNPGDSELLTISAGSGASHHTAYWSFSHQYASRYEAVTTVTWCTCEPLPSAEAQHIIDVVGAHLASLATKEP
jgi:hypothetical protein